MLIRNGHKRAINKRNIQAELLTPALCLYAALIREIKTDGATASCSINTENGNRKQSVESPDV